MAGCGSSGPAKPSESVLGRAIDNNAEFKALNLNAKQLGCITGVLHQYGSAQSLNQFVQGKITADDLSGTDRNQENAGVQNCVTRNR